MFLKTSHTEEYGRMGNRNSKEWKINSYNATLAESEHALINCVRSPENAIFDFVF